MKLCTLCKNPLPTSRVVAQPTATLCVSCLQLQGDIPRVEGFMTWEHKTAPVINVVTPQDSRMMDVYRQYTRRGVHAQLPFSSKGGSFGRPPQPLLRTFAVSKDSPAEVSDSPAGFTLEGDILNSLKATCHPDRPRATPQGKCVECAVEWYRTHGRVR